MANTAQVEELLNQQISTAVSYSRRLFVEATVVSPNNDPSS
jgi:hypothetical protein